jgi:hypothetical protein
MCSMLKVNGAMVNGVMLKVSMARRQPPIESASNVQDSSTTSWSSIGSYAVMPPTVKQHETFASRGYCAVLRRLCNQYVN